MPMNAVIHVDQEESAVLTTALGNIRNFLDQVQAPSDLRLVVNHNAVKFFAAENAQKIAATVSELASQQVRFLICGNSLSRLSIDPASLLPQCEVVPAGIVELIRLQAEGFAYVKP